MNVSKSLFGQRWLIPTLVLLGLTVASPRAADAQWAVFDASNWAELGTIWNQDVSANIKLAQELQQGLKLYQNAVQIYGVASQEATYLKRKQVMLAVGFLAQHAVIPGQPGWDKAMTTAAGIANAGAVWQQMSAPGGMNSMQALANRIKLADSFGTSILNSLGSCNAAATQTNGALGQLEQLATSVNQSNNTRAAQANLSNMGQTQQLRTQQCQQNIQMQQAKLQMLNALAQREQDQAAYTLRTNDAAVRSQMTLSNTAQDIQNVIDR